MEEKKTLNVIQDFPSLSRKIDGNNITYLDSAATSLKPKSVIDSICSYYSENSSNIHRGKHYLSEEASNVYEECRIKVAQLIESFSDEVIFTKNTTESINLVAHGLNFNKETDNVIICTDSHHSNYIPWIAAANAHIVKLNSDGVIDINHFKELIISKKPKLVAISHCSNVTGIYAPIDKLLKLAKEAGALTFLDVAQSIPHRKINVKKLDVDFIAFSPHKMLGPTGIGILYGKRNILEKLNPLILGGGTVDWVENGSYVLRKAPHKFEAGTPHIAGAYGFMAAIDYINKIGYPQIEAHDNELSKVLYSEAIKRDYIDIMVKNLDYDRSAILSFGINNNNNLGDIARALSDSYGLMCRSGHLCAQPLVDELTSGEVIRVSAYIYNTKQEIINFFNALDTIYQIYG
ncbi:MAG: aminotransferase class V-fold PLP-dependent enzyme [Bacteroidales bacterium]|nr:aminotransferase class V-fold PLP-dependent enzyme [Bacteroidales bacterium]